MTSSTNIALFQATVMFVFFSDMKNLLLMQLFLPVCILTFKMCLEGNHTFTYRQPHMVITHILCLADFPVLVKVCQAGSTLSKHCPIMANPVIYVAYA